MTELTEAGRVLSAANEKKLRNALTAIEDILSALIKPSSAQTEALRESFNVGEWIESRIHLYFTERTDDMFGYGNLTRDERIALSGAIGDALDAFRKRVEADAPQLYERMPGADPDDDEDPGEDAPMDEAAKKKTMCEDGDFGGGCPSCGYGMPAEMTDMENCPFCGNSLEVM